MSNEIEIGITTIENTIEITSQATDQVVDIGVTDNRDEVTINVTPTVIEININKNIPAENNLVTSVNTRIGDVVITAADVGLGNVDNTADFQKPISEDVQAALNVKADLIDGLVPEIQLPVTALSVMSGLSQGGVLSINTDTAKFNVSAGFGYIVNGHTNPDVPIKTRVAIDASTANVLPNIGSTPQTFVSIDINGVLNLTPNPLTPTERRNFIRLGVIIHLNNTTIEFIDNKPTVNIEVGGQVQDLLEAFGFRSLSGNRIFPVSTNLKIKKELGTAFKSGANFRNLSTQPHTFTLAAQNPITFRYRTQTGAEGSDITDINPAIYDVNGNVTSMPATATLATIQRVYVFQDNLIRIQLGQRFFNNLVEAITAINSDVFITDDDIALNGLYLGAIVMIRGTTNLSLLSQAVFIPSSGVSANGSTSAAPLGYTAEDAANKQNSLAADGTGAKYPTVDIINAEVVKLTGNQTIAGSKTLSSNLVVNGVNVGKSNTGISSNTFFGESSLQNITTGIANTAISYESLRFTTSGSSNTGLGFQSLKANTVGINNVALGTASLQNNVSGNRNVSVGVQNLISNTIGNNNTAVGFQSLQSNNGNENTAAGYISLISNTSGSKNSAFGNFSSINITSGSNNLSSGSNSLTQNTTGNSNVALGFNAGTNIASGNNTIVNNSIFIGSETRALANNQTNQIVIGDSSIGLGSNTSALGNLNTVFSRVWGRNLIGTSVDNGVDALQVDGSANISADAKINGLTIGKGLNNGNFNTAIGEGVLSNNSTGNSNTGLGKNSLLSNSTGANNLALGIEALRSNTDGNNNVAIGFQALFQSTTASSNSAIGYRSLFANTTGASNLAFGQTSLTANTTGSNSVAIGNGSLQFNTTGGSNMGIGQQALLFNTTGVGNSCSGAFSLLGNTTGSYNVASGLNAGRQISTGATNTITNNSIFIGSSTKALADNQTNQIVIGNSSVGLGSNTSVLGNTSTAFSRVFGRNLIGTSADNGNDVLQVNGTAQITGETKILDLAGSGNRNVSAAASGILVINTVYSVFADNAAAIAGGLQIGEFYRTSTGALFVRF